MKLRNLFLIAVLTGTMAVVGCGDDEDTSGDGGTGGTGGTAGTGGTGGTGGTAGAGGGGLMCDPTAEEVCAACEVPALIPDCVSSFGTCLETDPGGNVCEKCGVAAIADCRE